MIYMRHFCIIVVLLFLNLAQGLSLHDAIRAGDNEEFERLSSDERYLDEQDSFGNTPAHVAVLEGKIEYLKSLKEKGANFRLVNRLGDTLLHTFIKHGGSDEVFEWLMSQRLLLDEQNHKETSESQDDDSKKFRLNEQNHKETSESQDGDSKKSRLDDKNYGGNTPLLLAIKKGNLDQVKALVENGASPDSVNGEGETAFLIAVLLGDKDIVSALLKFSIKIDFQVQDLEGRSPIGAVVAQGDMEMFKRFLSYDPDVIHFVNLFGQTLLHISVAHNHEEMTQFLLDQKKIPVDAQDIDGNTALILAATRENLKEVTALVDHGADPTKSNKKGEDALHGIIENSERAQRVAQQITELGLEDADKDENKSSHHFFQDLNVKLLEYFLENFKVRRDLENSNGRDLENSNGGDTLGLLAVQKNILEELGNQQQVLKVLKRTRDDGSRGCQVEFE